MKQGILFLAAGALCVVMQMVYMLGALLARGGSELPGGMALAGLVGVGATVLLGIGAHRVLWAPPRDKSTVSPALRWVISAAIGMGLTVATIMVTALLAALLRARG